MKTRVWHIVGMTKCVCNKRAQDDSGALAYVPGWMVMLLTEKRNPRKGKVEGRASGEQIMSSSWAR